VLLAQQHVDKTLQLETVKFLPDAQSTLIVRIRPIRDFVLNFQSRVHGAQKKWNKNLIKGDASSLSVATAVDSQLCAKLGIVLRQGWSCLEGTGVFERVRAVMATLKNKTTLTESIHGTCAKITPISANNLDPNTLSNVLEVLHIYGFALVHYEQKEQVAANGGTAAGGAVPWQVKLSAACNALTEQSGDFAWCLFKTFGDNLFDLNMTGAAGPYVARAIVEERCKVTEGEYDSIEENTTPPALVFLQGLDPNALREALRRLCLYGFAMVYYAGKSLEAAYGSSAEGKPWQTSLSAACDKMAGTSGAIARHLFNAIRDSLFDLDRASLAGTLITWKLSEGTCRVDCSAYSHEQSTGGHRIC
jgi:hypothetical protein